MTFTRYFWGIKLNNMLKIKTFWGDTDADINAWMVENNTVVQFIHVQVYNDTGGKSKRLILISYYEFSELPKV